MSSTANLNIPFVKASQAQKHVTVNQSFEIMDTVVQLSVLSRTAITPPSTPADGDRYIVPDGSTGTWSEETNNVAVWSDNTWIYFPPVNGWRAWLEDEEKFIVWQTNSWMPMPLSTTELEDLDYVGINATADTGNRLRARTDLVTFEAETDDIRQVLNKNSASDTSSLIFQSAALGVAELGLTGDNDFHLRLSDDGTNWNYALSTDSTSRECYFHAPISLPQYSKNSLPSSTFQARIIYVTDATGGATPAYCDGSGWKRFSDNSTIN